MTIIREINQELVNETKFIEKALELFEGFEQNHAPEVIEESLIDLRADVRRYLINHPKISLPLAMVLAHIMVVAGELEKELAKSTKYGKEPTLKKMVEKLLQISGEIASKDDSPIPKLDAAITHFLDKLEGNKERIENIKKTFEKIMLRLTSNDTTLRLKAMKIAAGIMQSNNSRKERKQLIDTI